jgi:pimeloyl-ACP methyl ester carboxylesterase
MSWDRRFDPLQEEIRAGLRPGRHRDLFDLFAPPSDQEPERSRAEEMGHALAAAARRVDPLIEPAPLFDGATSPVHLLHGVQDHLIPSTEIRRLEAALPEGVESRATVTSLFGHSAQDPLPGWRKGVREAVRFTRALSGVLGVV